MIQFYKPNARSTGSACSFYKTRDGSLMVTLVKQASWNDAKKIGSFQKNTKDPNGNVKIKLSYIEAANILMAIENNIEFKQFHNSEKQSVQIRFAPYLDKETSEQKGFSLAVYRSMKNDPNNKANFLIGFTFPEARLVKEFLTYIIRESFKYTPKAEGTENQIEENQQENTPSNSQPNEADGW